MQKGNKNNNTNITLYIENITINISKSLKLLGITIDNKLIFEEHISVLFKKAPLQLNAISRLEKYVGKKKEKEATIDSLIYSNFNYFPLVLLFCSCKFSNKIEQIQKLCYRIKLNHNESDYETLLEKSSKTTMNNNEKPSC